ncbi:hypothetical protein [Paenibacillus sp. MBLB4367]
MEAESGKHRSPRFYGKKGGNPPPQLQLYELKEIVQKRLNLD